MISFMQIILMLAGAVSLSMAVNGVPAIWSSILPWLRPPYLHIVINGIIIAIAAASRFRRGRAAPPVRSQHLISVRTPPPAYYAAYTSSPEVRVSAMTAYESEDRVVELRPVVVNGLKVDERVAEEDDGENALFDRNLTYEIAPPEIISPEFRLEYLAPAKPTSDVSGVVTHAADVTQFKIFNFTMENSSKSNKKSEGTSRAAPKETRHGGAPRPTPDPFRNNTKSFRERTIYMDSPPSHASSAIRKKASPSREKSNRRVEFEAVDPTVMHTTLSPEIYSPVFQANTENPNENISGRDREEEEHETMESAWKKITEGASPAGSDDSQPSWRIGKELSPQADELKRRVEAFIKKVNDEIRLCRQKSLDQYIQLNSAA